MNKKLNIVTLLLLIPIIWFGYLYYSHKEFAFNAEFVVFLCFITFVALAYKTVVSMASSSMADRANDIKNEYSELENARNSSYAILINSLKKYSNLDKVVAALFQFAFEKSISAFNSKSIAHIAQFYQFTKKEISFLFLLNSIYLYYSKYYFIQLFSIYINQYYTSNTNQLVLFLNSINFIKAINKVIYKRNNKFFVNI